MDIVLLDPERQRLAAQPTDDLEAYDLYLLGLHFLDLRGESLNRAREYFQQAMARDSTYAEAYAGLASVYALLPGYVEADSREMRLQATATALRALALDSTLAEAHATLGLIAFTGEWDWASAERHLQQAIVLNPNHSNAHMWYAYVLTATGRGADAREAIGRALALDPRSVATTSNAGVLYLLMRDYERAIDKLTNAGWLAWAHYGASQLAEARAAWARWGQGLGPSWQGVIDNIPNALGEAAEAWDAIVKSRSWPQWSWVYQVAPLYAIFGDHESALAWLERSDAERTSLHYTLPTHPGLDGLRSEPRFIALLKNMGLE